MFTVQGATDKTDLDNLDDLEPGRQDKLSKFLAEIGERNAGTRRCAFGHVGMPVRPATAGWQEQFRPGLSALPFR